MNTRAFAFSAVIAGVVMALLGSLPFINFCNCLLCIWVWGSSILAVFLYRRFDRVSPVLSVGQGAILGVVAGVIGAFLGFLVEAVFSSASLAGAFDLLRSQPSLQPFVDGYLQLVKGGGYPILARLINLVLYAGFGAVGGILATSLIWKAPQTPVSA
jgi:hypothetical protein